MSTPIQRKQPVNSNQMSLVNNYGVDSVLTNFSVDEQITNTPVPTQSVLRDITAENKETLQYHLPFSDGEYSCHTSGVTTISSKQPGDPCMTSLDSVSISLDSQVQRSTATPKRQDIGSKKRKSKVQRKSGVFQEPVSRMDSLETTSKNFTDDALKKSSSDSMKTDCLENSTVEYRQIVRSESSFEDWIRQNLPEDDIIVNEKSVEEFLVTLNLNYQLQKQTSKHNKQKRRSPTSCPDQENLIRHHVWQLTCS